MEEGDSPPFWQPPATLTRRHKRQLSSLPILNSSLLIIILPSLFLLFIVFIIVPSIPKVLPQPQQKPNTPHISKHFSVNKSWDSLNILLVLFAILCGVFARHNEDVATTSNDQQQQREQAQPQVHNSSHNYTSTSNTTNNVLLQRTKSLHHHSLSSPLVDAPHWFDYSQQRIPSPSLPTNIPVTDISQLRRTVSLDPYMRDTATTDRFQFFDDYDLNRFYPSPTPVSPTLPPDAQNTSEEAGETTPEELPVETFVLQTKDELPSPTISPTPTLPRESQQRSTIQTLPRKEQIPPPSPPPPHTETLTPRRTEKKKKTSRNSTKEIATAIVSLYSHRKRKRKQKHHQKDDNSDLQPIQTQQFTPPPLPSPPPPPPQPPPSFLHNVFSKGSKSKKIHFLTSIPTPTPPPPPKPPMKPPLPQKRGERMKDSLNKSQPNVVTAAYKVEEEMKWKVRGECVGVKSRYGLREEGGEERVTCPSPDVNTKADTFIARHHYGWRLENINSWREQCHLRSP